MKVAIAGYGVVGGGVAELLIKNADVIARSAGQPVELKSILVRREYADDPYAAWMVRDFSVIEQDDEIDVLVETIGGCGAALDYCRRALRAGKSVVTANKQMVAEHGNELFALAREHGCNFLFEASVGGGIPVLNPLTRCLGANTISEVSGILNGTTNYILTQMLENGADYADALREAQARGYAEADPTADVEGIDAGRKACILAGLAFGQCVPPEQITMEGISRITALDAAFAAAAGMKIKLLGRALARGGELYVFTAPHFIPQTQLLASVSGVDNAILVRGSAVGTVVFSGPGAGRYPTASAVVGDVIDIAKHPNRPQPCGWDAEGAWELRTMDELPVRYFIRTSQTRDEAEQVLGKIDWLPDQDGEHGGITAATTRRALTESGLRLAAAWPVMGTEASEETTWH